MLEGGDVSAMMDVSDVVGILMEIFVVLPMMTLTRRKARWGMRRESPKGRCESTRMQADVMPGFDALWQAGGGESSSKGRAQTSDE